MHRLFSLLLLATGFVLLGRAPLTGLDEDRSLALLVDTLGVVDNPSTQSSLMQGMLSGLAGRRDVPAPDAWGKVAAKLAKSRSEDVRELSFQLSQIFGDESATQRALKIVQDRSAPLKARRRALHALLTQKNDQISSLLERLLDEPDLRIDAIRGYAAIENPRAGEILLGRYAKWPSELQKASVETLATRKSYAQALLNAIESKSVPRSHIPSHVARSLGFLMGDRFSKVFGDVRKLATDRTALMAKYKSLLTAEALDGADVVNGRAVYNKTCASCHVLYGTGGKIGPDLTGSNRGNLDYILLNSIDPSYDVPAGYKMVIVETLDGRVLNGVIAEENAQRIVLKTVEQPMAIILKSDIERRQVSPKSMMPEGQFDKMKPRQVIDLVRYLQTIEQVEAPK